MPLWPGPPRPWRRVHPRAVNTEVHAPTEEAGLERRVSEARVDRSARVALTVFVVVAVAVLPIVLLLARRYWFFWDEWDFLAGRDASRPKDLLRPHNEHWSTLPILVYRALWRLFSLRTHPPYPAVSAALHLTVAAPLPVGLRRARGRPRSVTAAPAVF